MGASRAFEEKEWYYWEGVVHWSLCFIIVFILTLYQGVYTYQDLRTVQRKSISHRATKPPITKSYTSVLVTVFISLLSFTALSIVAVFHFFVTDFIDGSTKCTFICIASAATYQIGKGSMYIVFFGRIHTVYSKSTYGYKPIFVFILILVVIIATATILLIQILFNTYEFRYKTFSFGDYAMHCSVNYANFMVMIVGVFDFVMCFLSAVAFINPLIKVYRSRMQSHEDVHNVAKLQKLTDIGQKYMIITSTAVLSTVFVMIWIGVIDTVDVVPYDVVINCVCMALMTPYYKDYHYQRLCCCCTRCVRLCCLKHTEQQRQVLNLVAVASNTPESTTKSKA
eukprot:83212_1